jgi:hypothetical protein
VKKTYYWAVMDRNREWPSMILPKQRDAKDHVWRWNKSLGYSWENPRFHVKRFVIVLKGKMLTEVDVYEHEFIRHKTKVK